MMTYLYDELALNVFSVIRQFFNKSHSSIHKMSKRNKLLTWYSFDVICKNCSFSLDFTPLIRNSASPNKSVMPDLTM